MPRVSDPPLTEIGRAQARCAGAGLRDEGVTFAALYASPMRRALETAQALESALHLAPHVLPGLCEAGGLREQSGMCREEILRDFPTATLDDAITDQGWWTPMTVEEEEAKVYARAAQSLALLRARHQASEDNVVVVTHGTYGSAFLSELLGIGPGGYTRFLFYNCAVSGIFLEQRPRPMTTAAEPLTETLDPDAHGELTRLLFHNHTAHLPPDLVTF